MRPQLLDLRPKLFEACEDLMVKLLSLLWLVIEFRLHKMCRSAAFDVFIPKLGWNHSHPPLTSPVRCHMSLRARARAAFAQVVQR